MKQNNTEYDPTIQGLLQLAEAQWGNDSVKENRKRLVPYGFKWLDLALWGIDVSNGEFIGIQGPEKGRKSTFLMNIVANMQQWFVDQDRKPPLVVIDTLESGMTPIRYRDALVSLMATRALQAFGHKLIGVCPRCKGSCKEIGFSPEFLMYNQKTEEQMRALGAAIRQMKYWNLHIYGASLLEGMTRDLDRSIKRWKELADQDAKIFVTDHIQQYSIRKAFNAYEKLERIIPALSGFGVEHKAVVIALSQVSLSSYKEARDGIGEMTATGGNKLAQEANTVFETTYDESAMVTSINIVRGRKSGKLAFRIHTDKTSGDFFGEEMA